MNALDVEQDQELLHQQILPQLEIRKIPILNQPNLIDGEILDLNPRTVYSKDWIWAVSSQREPQPNISEIESEWNEMKQGNVSPSDLAELAKRTNCRGGKWIMSCNSTYCIDVWKLIRNATLLGQLGNMSRVSRRLEGSR